MTNKNIENTEKELNEGKSNEIRKEIQGTAKKYLVSNFGRAQGPRGLLNSTQDEEGKKKIKTSFGHPQITITYRDGHGNIQKRKDKLISVLIADVFANEIEDYQIKDTFDDPRIIHKDGDKLNNQPNNLKRIDYNCKDYWREGQGRGYISYQTEQQDIIKALKEDPTLGNKELAKIIFKERYTTDTASQYDQFIYRERKKLENLDLIPVSQAKQANKKSKKTTQEIINLIKEKNLSGREIAKKFGVNPTTVSRIKKKRAEQKSNEN